jgi:hypothetical protein
LPANAEALRPFVECGAFLAPGLPGAFGFTIASYGDYRAILVEKPDGSRQASLPAKQREQAPALHKRLDRD